MPVRVHETGTVMLISSTMSVLSVAEVDETPKNIAESIVKLNKLIVRISGPLLLMVIL